MLSPNRLLISKLSCLNYTFIQLFTCQTFIWPTKHLCLTSDLQKNLNEIFRATTREQPLNRRISGWCTSGSPEPFFLCRQPLILHLQECDGSILCYYETILQVRGKVYFQSEVLAHQHTLRQRWRSELRTHTHTHTVDISRPNESADSRHVSVSDTHTPLVLFPAAVGALKLWYLRNSNQFQTSASSHVSSTLEGDLKLSLIYSHIAFGCGGNLFSQPLNERRRGKQSLCMLSFVRPVGNRWTSVKTVRSSCVFESFQGLSECCSKQSVHWQLFFTPCSWAHVEISLILSCVSQSVIMGVAVFLVKQRSLLMKIYLIHHLPSFLPSFDSR